VHKKCKKSIWCTIWILGVLLIAATLDARPDPPAVNPSGTFCKVLMSHATAGDAVTRHGVSAPTTYPFLVHLSSGGACEPFRPGDRMVLTVQAADASPPTPRRKPSIRS